MFSSRIRTKSLAHVCRSLGTMLHSGIDVKRCFKLAADKSGDPHCRRALREVVEGIDRGDDISTAMRDQGSAFPDLMIDMISVAEQSGALPEILTGLADHYENNHRLRKTFLGAIAWPVFQLVAAILVIALVIFIMGMIPGSSFMKHLFFGLSGGRGALVWLFSTFGGLAALLFTYFFLKRSFAGQQFLDPLLMKIPVVGGCMKSFAIARFSWCFYLTAQTGMPIKQSLTASLKATANGAFISRTKIIVDRVQSGETLTGALAAAEIFPADFLEMVDVGETSGTVPEALNRLSPQFEEAARRSLIVLTAVLAWLIWTVVAGFIIFFIMRFFLWYAGMLQDAASGNFDAFDNM